MKRVFLFLENALRRAVIFSLLIILLLSTYSLADMNQIYSKVNRPYVRNTEKKNKNVQNKQKKEGIWLEIENTDICYQVMQGKDNIEYLSKDTQGDYSLTGSIFLDYRNQPDFSDSYNIIYGHHMDGKSLFGALDSYYDENYFNAHKNGKLIAEGVVKPFYIFAIAVEKASDECFFDPLSLNNAVRLEQLRSNALIYDDASKEEPNIVCFSTCTAESHSSERTMLFAWLKKEDVARE